MKKLNTLLLLSGNDIPFEEAQVIIHQPTIKEIAYIGENDFFIGCGLLNFSKDLLDVKDKSVLDQYDDFDILMSIMISKEKSLLSNIENAEKVLMLMFPLYSIGFEPGCITLTDSESKVFQITKDNFSIFKGYLKQIFNLNVKDKDLPTSYNPSGDMSSRIAEKLKKRHQQLAQLNNEKGDEIRVFSRYTSILAVGLKKPFDKLFNYTVYQLYDEFQRFSLKTQHDLYIKAKLAGAKDMKEVEDWMKDLHDKD